MNELDKLKDEESLESKNLELIPAPKNILIEMMEREIQAMRDALE